MKRKIFSILFTLVLVLSLSLVPVVASATTYNRTLDLDNKTDFTPTGWALTPGDSIDGTLDYNASGDEFAFSFTARGLTLSDYSLIYYADQEDRFNYWGGDNPGAVIATFTGVSGTISSGDLSVDLGMNLPCPPDANMYDHDYTTAPDNYDNAHGAKIWLVPTSALTSEDLPVQAWPPTNDWLFETELIWYTDTDTGSAVGLTSIVPAITAIDVSPTSIDFGTVYPGDVKPGPAIIVSNTGTVLVKVDATVAPVTGVFKYLKLGKDGGTPAYSSGYLGLWVPIITSLSPNSGQGVGTLLDVPSDWSAYGPLTATLTFTATAK